MAQSPSALLLVQGNTKLGSAIHAFSLPAGLSCPGRSRLCYQHCYARQGHYLFASVQQALARNYRQSQRAGFVDRMVGEILGSRARVVRIHASGDFYSPGYARQWLKIARSCPAVRFYAYSRSWRAPALWPVLQDLARLLNVRLWLSCDAQTGIPSPLPEGVKVAWLQTEAGEPVPEAAAVVFRIRRLRRLAVRRIGLSLVCPRENGATGQRTDCGRCGVCWGQDPPR